MWYQANKARSQVHKENGITTYPKKTKPKKSRHYMKEKSLDTAHQIMELIDQGFTDEERKERIGKKRDILNH